MFRDHLAAWMTVAFAVLLVMLTVADQGPGAAVASVLLLFWALALLGVFLVVEQRVHRRHRKT